MLIVELVSQRHLLFVPPVISRLVAPDEQERCSPGVKRVQDTVWPASVLDSQLSHVAVPGSADPGTVGMGQMGAPSLQESDCSRHRLLLGLAEVEPPLFELVGVFDFGGHAEEYTVEAI